MKQNSPKAWLLAARPKTLTGAAVPVMIGVALAYIDAQEFGTFSEESVDYPVYAYKVAQAVAGGECEMGILCCGTGIGISMAANKVKGIRAAVVHNEFGAEMTRRHNHANVLCMGGRVTTEEDAVRFTDIFLNTPEEGGRHDKRVAMLTEIENGTFSV